MNAEVIVVGLGAVGAAALYQLARRGVPAIGVDRFSPPHDLGSSHGETRITRAGVGEGEVYTPLAIRSHAIWRELEAATGLDLMLACGMLAIEPAAGGAVFHGRPDFATASASAASRHGVQHEMLDADEIRRRWPPFLLRGDERGYYETGGGLVYPERCIAAQLAEAERLGARVIRDARVVRLDETPDGVAALTERATISGATMIVAAGAWTGALLELPPGLLSLKPQTLHWFEAGDDAAYGADRFPTFIWSRGVSVGESGYGFPIAPSAATAAVKIGVETDEVVDCPEQRGEPDAGDFAYSRAIAGRLDGLSPRPVKSAVCLYTSTRDGDFVIGRPRGRPRTLMASACSGHGFKHSAAVGEMLAEAAIIGDHVIPPAFDPERFRMADLIITPIGHVRGGRAEPVDDDWGASRARIELDAASFGPEALAGLADFSHLEVIFVFDKVSEDAVERGARRPRGRADWPLVGIFAQRGKNRPNRLGLCVCRILAVDGLIIEVEGLDAIDGTPVVDLKPVMSGFLPRGEVREPEWARRIMARYWE